MCKHRRCDRACRRMQCANGNTSGQMGHGSHAGGDAEVGSGLRGVVEGIGEARGGGVKLLDPDDSGAEGACDAGSAELDSRFGRGDRGSGGRRVMPMTGAGSSVCSAMGGGMGGRENFGREREGGREGRGECMNGNNGEELTIENDYMCCLAKASIALDLGPPPFCIGGFAVVRLNRSIR